MKQALLLDKNYMALSLVDWKKAIKLMVKGKAEPVTLEKTVASIKGATKSYGIPSILRLLVVVPWKAHQGRLKFSRRSMLIRDGHKCQYCGTRVGKNASVDHVMPKSRGGKTDFLNCVTSCKNCNNKKADRTPEEAKMRLLSVPKRPTFMNLYKHYIANPPDEWRDYLIGM
jgi:5-methylcytosine-specific restriction endonuclease McrA